MGRKKETKSLEKRARQEEFLALVEQEVSRRAGSDATYEQIQETLASVLKEIAAKWVNQRTNLEGGFDRLGKDGTDSSVDSPKTGLDK